MLAIANSLEGSIDSAASEVLTKIAEEDTNSVVRDTATSACINIIKGQVRGKEKGRFGILEEETKMDSNIHKSEKFDLLEEISILS